ncbi:hypothetical protein GCM10027082_16270 [Comamonas humi]
MQAPNAHRTGLGPQARPAGAANPDALRGTVGRRYAARRKHLVNGTVVETTLRGAWFDSRRATNW